MKGKEYELHQKMGSTKFLFFTLKNEISNI